MWPWRLKRLIELPPEIIEQRFGVSPTDGVTTEVLDEMTGGMDGVAIVYTNKGFRFYFGGRQSGRFRQNQNETL